MFEKKEFNFIIKKKTNTQYRHFFVVENVYILQLFDFIRQTKGKCIHFHGIKISLFLFLLLLQVYKKKYSDFSNILNIPIFCFKISKCL